MYAAIFHVDLIDGLVVLIEGSCVEKLDGVEVRNHCNQFVLLAVLSQ
jgi:hypothetical protein